MPKGTFYQSEKWRKTRLAYLAVNPYCFVCALVGFKTKATQVDHKKTLATGGAPFDFANLQGMCHSHHSQKTFGLDFQNRGSRVALVTTGADGYPVHVEKPSTRNAKPKKY